MTILPEPKPTGDPIAYLRQCHHVIAKAVGSLDEIARIADAEPSTLKSSQAWNDLLHFFTNQLPIHEMDEEATLFPVLYKDVPHAGFQPPQSVVRFLIEGHKVLNARAADFVGHWNRVVSKLEILSVEDVGFVLASAHELVRLLHEHMTIEETLVYSRANEILTPFERLAIMQVLVARHADSVSSGVMNYDNPVLSMPNVGFSIGQAESQDGAEDENVDATGSEYEGGDEEEEQEEEQQEEKAEPN